MRRRLTPLLHVLQSVNVAPRTRRGIYVSGLVIALGLAGIVPVLAPSPATAAVTASKPGTHKRVSALPDQVSASIAAKAQGSRVEITDDRTENATTWANPDGSLTTDSSITPIRAHVADGSWQPVNYSLAATDGGFAPKSSPADVWFSGGGAGPAAVARKGARELDLSLDRGTDTVAGGSWSAKLPAPVIKDNSATYRLNDSVSLVLTATGTGMEESFILDSRPADVNGLLGQFHLRATTTGLTALTHGHGVAFSKPAKGTARSESAQPVISVDPVTVFDSEADASGDPSNTVTVPSTLTADPMATNGTSQAIGVTDASGTAPEELTSFLSDPSTVYPVTIDPAVNLVELHDTWIQQNDTTSHGGDRNMKIGYSGGAERRGLLQFNVTPVSGMHVTAATLKLFQTDGSTCTAEPIDVFPVEPTGWADTVTWSNQPTVTSTNSASASWSHGYDSTSCPNGYGSIDVTAMVNSWAHGATNNGMELRAGNETDAAQDKTLCSKDWDSTSPACFTTSHVPVLSTTYNSIPASPAIDFPSQSAANGDLAFMTAAPNLKASATNTTGGTITLHFTITHDPAAAYTDEADATNWSGSVATTSGIEAGVTVPYGTLTSQHHYDVAVSASVVNGAGGTDSGPTVKTGPYVIDDAGLIPTRIDCPDYPNNTWSPAVSGEKCTLSGASTLAGFYYSWDDPDPATWIDATNGSATVAAPTTSGRHKLYAAADDEFYRQGATSTYTAEIGAGGLLTPADKTITQTEVTLSAQSGAATGGHTSVTYWYREGNEGSLPWAAVPASDVKLDGTSTTLGAWPQAGTAGTGGENYANLDWNIAATIHAVGGTDGPVQVTACFDNADPNSAPSQCSNINTVILATSTFANSAGTTDLGPGEVSLNTGDFELSAADASEAGMSVGRTATSLRMLKAGNNSVSTTSPTGIFGPGWQATLPGADIGEADETLTDHSSLGYLTVAGSDGDTSVYQVSSGSGATAIYTGVAEANDGSTITCSSASAPCTAWTETDLDGTTTTWTQPTGATSWTVSKVVAAGSAATNTTTFTRDVTGRITRILAPVAAGVTCGAGTAGLNPGCQALSFIYAASTTATGTANSAWGDYAGLVSGISYTAYDPATTAMKTVQVAAYAYDDTGHLRASWDPRISPALKTTYDYDSQGRITGLTPPGRARWTMTYDDSGRLASVSRPDPANGTASQEVVYGIDPGVDASTGLPNLLDATTGSSSWGQSTDLAYTGAAIFPASHPLGSPDSHGDYHPTSSDWPYGDLSYTDTNGRIVDHITYGAGAWQIDSTRYNANGDVVWSLTALNRDRALSDDTTDTAPAVSALGSSAARADALATISVYPIDSNGIPSPYVAFTQGSSHVAAYGADKGLTTLRSYTSYFYDSGAPSSLCPCHLVTRVTTMGLTADQALWSQVDLDSVQTTTNTYSPVDGSSDTGNTSGWVLRKPTWSYQTDNSGNKVGIKYVYNAQGQVVSKQMPGSNGADAGTTLTTYYTATGTGTCGGKPQWAGLECQTAPAAQPSGASIPSTVTTYDMYLNPVTVTDTSGSSTRTTTTTYDAGERTTGTAITASSDAGTPVPATTTEYDPATGDVIAVKTGTGSSATTITSAYNSLGEETSYTDADGNTSTSTYDIDGNLHSLNDGKGTYTYGYDGTDANGKAEHRGLLTSIDTGMSSTAADFAGSTFTGAYDADGNLITEDYPNGLAATARYDATDDARSLTYAKDGATWLAYTSNVEELGRTASQSSPSSTQQFTYDTLGRLTNTAEQYQGSCITRAYSFNLNSDRTNLTTTTVPLNSDGTCNTSGGGSYSNASSTFDSADRLTNSGYAYDNFGRTTAVQMWSLAHLDLANLNDLNVGYYTDDMVASQTQGTASKTFTLDPAARLRAAVDTTSGAETRRTLNHYADASDSPSWIATSTDAGSSWTWERNVIGLDGNLAALQESDATAVPQLQLTNLHGDIVATVDDTTDAVSTNSTTDPTEYGVPRDITATPARYGWVGAKRRSSDDLAGLVLMGVRLYNPATGRFLSMDPIPGGNANAYTYPLNPMDKVDLNGKWWHELLHHVVQHFVNKSESTTSDFVDGVKNVVNVVHGANKKFITFKNSRVGKYLSKRFGPQKPEPVKPPWEDPWDFPDF